MGTAQPLSSPPSDPRRAANTTIHVAGGAGMFLAAGMLATAAVGWGYDDPAAGDLATAGATVGPLSLAMWRWTEPEANLRRGSAFTVVGFAWIYAFIVATIPYLLAGTFDSFVNALFESVSGLTTTGSTVLADIEAQGKGILLYRQYTQWFGGGGIGDTEPIFLGASSQTLAFRTGWDGSDPGRRYGDGTSQR